MSRIPKVEIQKGNIDANPMTMKQQRFFQKVEQQREENALRRSAQTLTLHMPKK
jgi:hypothetical protein